MKACKCWCWDLNHCAQDSVTVIRPLGHWDQLNIAVLYLVNVLRTTISATRWRTQYFSFLPVGDFSKSTKIGDDKNDDFLPLWIEYFIKRYTTVWVLIPFLFQTHCIIDYFGSSHNNLIVLETPSLFLNWSVCPSERDRPTQTSNLGCTWDVDAWR